MNSQELTILNNISSLLTELSGIIKADDEGQDDMAIETPMEKETSMAEDVNMGFGMNEDEEDDNLLEKGLETTLSDGAVANDDAEERIDDPLPDESADNVDEVAKSVLKLVRNMNANKTVKKSVKTDKTTLILSQLTKVTKSLLAKQQQNETAITKLIEGFGLADNIEKMYSTENTSVQKGLANPTDTNQTLEYIAKALGQTNPENEKKDTMGQATSARKSVHNFIQTYAQNKK